MLGEAGESKRTARTFMLFVKYVSVISFEMVLSKYPKSLKHIELRKKTINSRLNIACSNLEYLANITHALL